MTLSTKCTTNTVVKALMYYRGGEIPTNVCIPKPWMDGVEDANVFYTVSKHNDVYEFTFYCPDNSYDRFKSVTIFYDMEPQVRQYGKVTLIMRADGDNSSPHPVLKAISWYEDQ